MSYSDAEVFAATSAMDKYRGGEEGEAAPLWSSWASARRGQPKKWGSATI